jgi:hypothetical protein
MENSMKVGGRNYGFGHQFSWAGREALIDHYGQGHFGTIQAHADRFKKFVQFCRAHGIRDAREVTLSIVADYGKYLSDLIFDDELEVSYAQNLLSTINVTMKSLRGDRTIFISPSETVGKRCHIRTDTPTHMSVEDVQIFAQQMERLGEPEIAAIVLLARCLGLRFRECALLDSARALREAVRKSHISLNRGTKGGRPRQIQILFDIQKEALGFAAAVQGKRQCLIPERMKYDQWRNYAYGHLYKNRFRHFHDLRSAFACSRYEIEAGVVAPVLACGAVQRPSKEEDKRARIVVSRELGHNRHDVLNAYIGSWHH